MHVNPAAMGRALAARLPASYSQKALTLKNVRRTHAWYRPGEGAVVESLVLPPVTVNPDETAVACARVGRGKLGYMGDVNAEKESDDVILAMIGF